MRNKRKTRLASLLLCGVMLLSFCPTAVFAVESANPPLHEVATIEQAELYEGETPVPTTGQYQIENPNNLEVRYTFSVSEEQLREIQTDQRYQIPVPQGLQIIGSGSSKLDMTIEAREKLHFATLVWGGGGATLQFTKEVKEAADTGKIDSIEGGYLHFGCAFDKETAQPSSPKNYYTITFEDRNSTSVTVGLKEDFEERKAELQKRVQTIDGKQKWTITYKPYRNTEKTDFEIRDTLGKALRPVFAYDAGGAVANTAEETGVSVTRDGSKIENCVITYQDGLLRISGMGESEENQTQPITISYYTTINYKEVPPELSLPNKNANMTGTLTNQGGSNETLKNIAALYGKQSAADAEAGELGITSESGVRFEQIRYLNKSVERINERLLKWTITVNRGYIEGEITLTDTLPDSLTLVQEADGAASAPTWNGELLGEKLTVREQQFSVKIGAGGAALDEGTGVLVYYTKVKESYFESGKDLGNNTVQMAFMVQEEQYTPQVTVSVGQGAGLNTIPLQKKNIGFAGDKDEQYLRSERSSRWEVCINPNKAALSEASLTDKLSLLTVAGKDCGGAHGHQTGSSLNWNYPIQVDFAGEYNGSVEITGWSGEKSGSIGTDMAVSDVSEGALLTLSETEGGDLLFQVGNVGKTEIKITYVSQLNDPCVFAANHVPKNNGDYEKARNTVAGSMTLGGQLYTVPDTVYAEAPISSSMLVKQPPVYDYSSGQMQWTVVVNESEMPLTEITLVDQLQAGLSYVEGSLTVNKQSAAEKAKYDGDTRTLTITLGEVSGKTTVTFRTDIDPDTLGFGDEGDVRVSNTISMTGKAFDMAFGSGDAGVSSKTEQTFVNHGLTKGGKPNEQTEQIDYTVVINPFHVPLEGAEVIDSLPSGLRLDPDSVQLYKAKLSGDTGVSGSGKPKPEQGEPITEGWKLTVNYQENTFIISLPQGDGAYVLCYSADILNYSEGGNYTNTIAFRGQTGMGGTESSGAISAGGGGGGASASKKGSIAITKQGENGELLSGVGFALYQWDNDSSKRGSQLAFADTDSSGALTFAALKADRWYELVEQTAAAGYDKRYEVAGDLPEGVQINEDGNLIFHLQSARKEFALTLTNPRLRGSLTFPVVNEHGVPIGGAVFEVYEQQGGKPIGTAVSNERGEVVFTDLPYAGGKKYYIQQIQSSGAYQKDEQRYEFTIGADGLPSGITQVGSGDVDNIVNTLPQGIKTEGSLTVLKVDSADKGKTLSGAEFTLYADADC